MANNLEITIGADATQLRAQLALAQSQMRATVREMNALANTARRTGSELDFAKLAQSAGQLEQVTAEVSKLKGAVGGLGASLETNITHGFAGMGSAIREPLDALAMMSSRLRETAEIAGLVFAADKVKEWVKGTAEAGERAVNLSQAIGTSLQSFLELQGVMRLAGGDAELASRSMEQMARTVGETLANPASQGREALRAMGISLAELRANADDAQGMFKLFAAAWNRFADSPSKTAAFEQFIPRINSMIPLLRQSAAQIDANTRKFNELDPAARAAALAGAEVADKFDELKVATKGLSDDAFVILEPVIRGTADAMKSFVGEVKDTLDFVERLLGPLGGLAGIFDHIASSGMFGVARALGQFATGNFTAGANQLMGRGTSLTLPAVDVTDYSALNEGYGWAPNPSSKPRLPWMGHTTGGGGGEARPEDDLARVMALEEQGFAAMAHANETNLAGFKAQMQTMVAAKQVTPQQAGGFQIQALYGGASQELGQLDKMMELADAVPDSFVKAREQARIFWQEWDLGVATGTKFLEIVRQIGEETKKAADAAAKAWAEPFKKVFDEIGGGLEKALTDTLLHRQNKDWGRQLYQSMVGDAVGFAGGILSKSAAGLVPGAKEGEGLGEALSTFISQQLLQLAQMTTGNAFAAATAANTAITASAATVQGAEAAPSAAGSAVGGLASVGTFIKMLFFAKGGIVPSAAGGWALPNFAGMQPAMLHGGEMVLPSDLSAGMQSLIRSGGAGAPGAGDLHVHIAPGGTILDGPSFQRWFLNQGGRAMIHDTIRSAFRSNALTPRTV